MDNLVHAQYDGNSNQVLDPHYEAGPIFTQPVAVDVSGTPAVLTNPLFQATASINNYTQSSTQNKSAGVNSSADHICYPDNVTTSDLTGFVDMGITSSLYSQAAYGVTVANEAYLFGSAPSGASKTGNLILCTDSTGTENSIWFGTAGFTAKTKLAGGFKGSAGDFVPWTAGKIGLGVAGQGFSKLYIDYTNTGTIGAVTINKAAGRVNVAAAASSVVVTNSMCTAASHVMAVVSTADATAILKNVVPAAGSFTINFTAAATANCSVDFFIVNAD